MLFDENYFAIRFQNIKYVQNIMCQGNWRILNYTSVINILLKTPFQNLTKCVVPKWSKSTTVIFTKINILYFITEIGEIIIAHFGVYLQCI